MDKAENQVNDLQHKEAKNNQSEQEEKRIQKYEDSINSLWDNVKRSNIHIIGVPEGKESKKMKIYLEKKTVKENFPNLVKEIDMQVQEAHRDPIMMDAKRSTPRHQRLETQKQHEKSS